MRIRNYLPALFSYLVLTTIVAILFSRNYTPGTWLTGWDNLHPEFDFTTNIIERSIFSVWQEYQGLGLHAGNAHAADLLRQIGLWFLSLIFAPNLLRYSYHFAALLTGTIGMYMLLTRRVLTSLPKVRTLAALAGALVYLLNLGTMQNFYVPYEAFSHFYASLPWLLFTLLGYLQKPTRRSMFFLIVANILATPMSYIPTIFIVYLMIVGIVLVGHLTKRHTIERAITALFIIALVNAYWLLPFLSFVRGGTDFVTEVKINRMFTQEAFLRSSAFGDARSIAMLKGFLFDTTDLVDAQNGHDFLMRPWITHLANPWASGIFVGLFGFVLLGYFAALGQKRPLARVFVGILILSLFMLMSDSPPTGSVFLWLREHTPLFGQVLRFPYTKFVVVASLGYGVGAAYFFSWLLPAIPRAGQGVTMIGLATVLVFANLPSFTGNFIYSRMRQTIPDEYFALFSFFQSQDRAGRIANLPQPTFWGWTAYDWGYRGSGFPWYGIPQPILDRAFDVWNPANERYYEELSRSIYNYTDPSQLQKVLEKYTITYLWIDGRVILPDKPKLVATAPLMARIEAIPGIQKIFTAGKQTVYRYAPNATSSFMRAIFGPIVNGRIEGAEITKTDGGVRLMTTLPAGTIHVPPLGGAGEPTLAQVSRSSDAIKIEPILPGIFLGNVRADSPQETAKTLIIPLPRASSPGFVQLNDTLVSSDGATGTAILSPTNNYLAVYGSAPDLTGSLGAIAGEALHNCADGSRSAKTVFSKTEESDGSITLSGMQSHPCVYAPMTKLLPLFGRQKITIGIIQLKLRYQSTTGASPVMCLTKEGETDCFYRSPDVPATSDGLWHEVVYRVPLFGYPLDKTWFKLELAADGGDRTQRIRYGDVSVAVFASPVHKQSFAPPGTQTGYDIPFTGGVVAVTIHDYPTVSILPASLPKGRKNCYTLGKGSFDRTVVADESEGQIVEYQATDASSCDWYYVEAPALSLGGVVSYRTKNMSGRPIKTCLKMDPPGYCLYEDILFDVGSDWSTVWRVTPPIGLTHPQLFVEFDNYAVGREKRVNRISRIDFTALPVSWLTSLTFTDADRPMGVLSDKSGSPVSAQRINPVYYLAKLDPAPQGNQTLILSQSFDNGWIAIAKTNSFPFFAVLKNHILVNNWSNGWTLPSNEVTNNELTIVIFFLPQLWQWLGFALLPLPFLALLWYSKK